MEKIDIEKIITVTNLKGGTGKTSIVYKLGKHLECNFYELKEDFLTFIEKENCVFSTEKDKKIENILEKIKDKIDEDEFTTLQKELNKNILIKSGIYDINTQNTTAQKINNEADIIIIPTLLSYKDCLKTIKTIENINNNKCKFIIIFNKICFTKNKKNKELINNYKLNLFKNNFIKNIEDKDRICFLEFKENGLWSKETGIEEFIKDEKILDEFTKNEILEILYQYSFFYSFIYKKKKEKIKGNNKNIKDEELENKILNERILTQEEIEDITKDFVKSSNFPKVSKNSKLLSFLGTDEEIEKFENVFIEEDKEEKLNNNEFKLLMQKEYFLHNRLKEYLNFKIAYNNRQFIKNFRELLIEIDLFK